MSRRKHEHTPECPYKDLSPTQAWGRHIRNMLIGWLVLTVVLGVLAALVGKALS